MVAANRHTQRNFIFRSRRKSRVDRPRNTKLGGTVECAEVASRQSAVLPQNNGGTYSGEKKTASQMFSHANCQRRFIIVANLKHLYFKRNIFSRFI